MTGLPTALLTATSAALVGFGTCPAAHADDLNPLYVLVDTTAQRLLTADPVAAFKWTDHGSVEDPKRVAAVVESVRADATAHHIDPQYVQLAFEDQIHANEGVQYTRFGQWKLDPASAPTVAPDLSSSRTAIDGFNHTIVNEVALQWNSLHGPDCAAERDDARAAVTAARQLDPLYQQALSFATGSYCAAT